MDSGSVRSSLSVSTRDGRRKSFQNAMEFRITIVEMMGVIGNGLDASSTSSMNECMDKHHVRKMVNTALTKVNADSFEVKYGDTEETLPFDYGFVCLGMKAYAPIWDEIQQAFDGEDVEVLNIGDSVRARRIIDGVDAGRHLVLSTLDRLGYR